MVSIRAHVKLACLYVTVTSSRESCAEASSLELLFAFDALDDEIEKLPVTDPRLAEFTRKAHAQTCPALHYKVSAGSLIHGNYSHAEQPPAPKFHFGGFSRLSCCRYESKGMSRAHLLAGSGFRFQSLCFSRAKPRMPDADLGKCLLKGLA